jgi:hypothetical protein
MLPYPDANIVVSLSDRLRCAVKGVNPALYGLLVIVHPSRGEAARYQPLTHRLVTHLCRPKIDVYKCRRFFVKTMFMNVVVLTGLTVEKNAPAGPYLLIKGCCLL